MWKLLITPVAALAIGMTAGCGRPQRDKTVAAAPRPPPAAAPAVAPQLAAAEPFEALTETAFAASKAEIETTARKAEAAAKAVSRDLPADTARALAARVAEVQAALQKDDRADLAIASAEAYRILVSAAPRAKVPVEVSLLDYAGFRYRADLAARPARWADAAKAAAFARGQWDAISPRVSDPALRVRVDQAVAALGAAQAKQDPVQADQAAQTELDLVDALETYFNAQPPAP